MRDTDHIPVLLAPVLDVLLRTPPAPRCGTQRRGVEPEVNQCGATLSNNSGVGRGSASPGGADERASGSDPATPLIYADATAGLGGHAAAIAQRLPPGSTVILNDLDDGNLTHAAARVAAAAPHVTLRIHRGNFAALPRWLADNNLAADLFLADLGFASTQVDNPARGLSFQHDGPLDMRYATQSGTTAAELIASLPEPDLAQILFEWGEERHSRPIARAIVEARKSSPITTTAQLGDVVRRALRGKAPPREVTGIDPATKTFQALRIAVNDELGNLHALLDQIEKAAQPSRSPVRNGAKRSGAGSQECGASLHLHLEGPPRLGESGEGASKPRPWLSPSATAAIITFHSLEDRPIKQSFVKLVEAGRAEEATPRGKPIAADEEEIRANPRARSAKLRAIRLTGTRTNA